MSIFLNNNISVKEYLEEDLESFVEMFMDFELCKFMPGGAFDTKHAAEKLFFHLLKINEQKSESRNYGIFENGIHIGHFEINDNSFVQKDELEIVFLLKKEYWGKGIIFHVIKWFQTDTPKKLIARVQPNNMNSLRMLEKISIQKQTISRFEGQNVFKITLEH